MRSPLGAPMARFDPKICKTISARELCTYQGCFFTFPGSFAGTFRAPLGLQFAKKISARESCTYQDYFLVYKPLGSRKAHVRNTPPPGGMGQGAAGKGWLTGWLGWLGCLAGLAGLGCWQARLGWLAWLAGWLAGWLVHCPAG